MTRPRIALVGAGRMAANHARVISESPDAELDIIVDCDEAAAGRLADRHQVRSGPTLESALTADAAVIATSTDAHLECARPFLEAGIPVLLEKPLAPSIEQVDELIVLAERKDTPLMCGLVERFNAALVAGREQIGDEQPLHIVTVRHSPPAPHTASSVVADLLLHDLDLMLRLFDSEHADLAGVALHRPIDAEHHEIATCSLRFAGGIASLSASRLGQRKIRTLSVYTNDRLVEIDLLRPDVTVYRNVSQNMIEGGAGYRSSTEIDIPFVKHQGEPLALQLAHFMSLVDGRLDHDLERRGLRPPHRLMSEIERAGASPIDTS